MTSAKQDKFDASKPFYAWVGASDLALERARKVAGQVTSQLEGVRTQVLGATRTSMAAAEQRQARVLEQVSGRLDELAKEARDAQSKAEARVAELQAEALELPKQAQARVEEIQADFKALVERFEARAVELREQLTAASREQRWSFDRLAARGETVVGRTPRDSDAGSTDETRPSS